MTVECYVGEIRLFAGDFTPSGWLVCNGQLIRSSYYPALADLLGLRFGGDGINSAAVPNLAGVTVIGTGKTASGRTYRLGEHAGTETASLQISNMPAHTHAVRGTSAIATKPSPVGNMFAVSKLAAYSDLNAAVVDYDTLAASTIARSEGESAPRDNTMPTLVLNHIIATFGRHPTEQANPPEKEEDSSGMDSMVGEIRAVPFHFEPAGWLPCDGRALSLENRDYMPLFTIIGTKFGGNGSKHFNLPDLRGRIPAGAGRSSGGSMRNLGDKFGTETVRLNSSHLPAHSHAFQVSRIPGHSTSPEGRAFASSTASTSVSYAASTAKTGTMDKTAVASYGTEDDKVLPIDNRQPFLAMKYFICYAGDYPEKS